MDLDSCGGHTSKDLGAFRLYNLSKALVRMKALQDRYVASEGVIQQFPKTKALAKETCRLEEVKTNLATELATLREQVKKARAVAVAEFRISQPFFDACGIYYGNGFEDCLKQAETNGVVIAQPAPSGLDGLPAKNLTTADDLPTVHPTVPDAPPS
nr:hypothetical protein CFP56_77346 [Quercus suber]